MRNPMKAAAILFCVATMTTILSTGARADFYDRTTTITFSAPVEIPGVHLKGYSVLPAGTYVFKLMDSTSNRHIVQIFTSDQSKCLATILAIPNTRLKLSDKTVVTFRERPDGEPPALRAWFYPGAAWGDEFVYGKKKAKEIAQATQTPVLYNNTDSDETANAEVTAPIQTPRPAEVQQMNRTEVKAYSPTGAGRHAGAGSRTGVAGYHYRYGFDIRLDSVAAAADGQSSGMDYAERITIAGWCAEHTVSRPI